MQYWRKFGRMNDDEREFVLVQANIKNVKQVLKDIHDELEREELLLQLAHQKNEEDLTEEQIKKIYELKMLKIERIHKKSKPVYDMIKTKYFWLIKDLRKNGLGWRKVEEYIRVHNHKKIPFTTLSRVFKQIEEETKLKNTEVD